MPPHLLCCQRLAVDDYSFALGRLTERSGDPASGEAGAASTFAQLGCEFYGSGLFQTAEFDTELQTRRYHAENALD